MNGDNGAEARTLTVESVGMACAQVVEFQAAGTVTAATAKNMISAAQKILANL